MKFGRNAVVTKRAMFAGASTITILLCATSARAACDTNPTMAFVTTTCSGIEINGLVVGTNGSTVNIDTGAIVRAPIGLDAILVTTGTPASDLFFNTSAINVNGLVDGGARNGILVREVAAQPGQYPYPSVKSTITVSAGATVTGAIGLSATRDPANPFGQVAVFVDNSGAISGSNGIALSAPSLAAGDYLSINNWAGGQIGSIYAQPLVVTNAGTISDTGAGAAIWSPKFLSLTNLTGGTINGSLIAEDRLVLINRGVINGSILAGSNLANQSSIIDTSGGGLINGNITLYGGDDSVIADFGTTAHPIMGITGTINAGAGQNKLQLNFGSDTTLSDVIAVPTSFQKVVFGIGLGVTLTLADGFNATTAIETTEPTFLGGGGLLVNNAALTFTGPAINNSAGYYGVSLTNNGSIVSSKTSIGQVGISIENGGKFSNTGLINIAGGGVGVNLAVNNTFNNSGTLIADGTTVRIFDATFVNNGTIRSNADVGIDMNGNVGIPATNNGMIYGAIAGARVSGYNLINTGTISSPGTGVLLNYYGSVDNRAGGVISGGIGGSNGATFNVKISNAGTINGNVDLGSSFSNSNNTFIALAGGIVNGNLNLGGGGDTFVTSLTNTGSGQFAGVTGTVRAGGVENLRYVVDADTTATLPSAGIFSNVGYELTKNAVLTLSAPVAQNLALGVAGSGKVDLTADLTLAGGQTILSLNAQSLINPGTQNTLNVTSRGTLTGTHDQIYASAGPVVALPAAGSFTNLGTIVVHDLAPNGAPMAAIAGGGVGVTVTNAGTISLDGGVGISAKGLTVINSGVIGQAAGGADGQGIVAVSSLINTGSIITGGPAVSLGNTYFLGATLTNSGLLQSFTGPAIFNNSPYGGGQQCMITNLTGGVISGPPGGTAVAISGGTIIDNAGTINGDVNLALPTAFGYPAYGDSTYFDHGGTVHGSLTFGAGNDTFVSLDGATGVTGLVDGGGGVNTFVRSYSIDTIVDVATAAAPAINFQRFGIGANGVVTTVTVTGPQAGIDTSLLFFGDGVIVNQTNINASQNPFVLNTVALGTFVPLYPYDYTGSTLSFVNHANIADGVQGAVRSFGNSGTIGALTLNASAVYLVATGGPNFAFANTGSISSSGQYSFFVPAPGVQINQGFNDPPFATASIGNDGSISSGLNVSLLAKAFSFSNSGVIAGNASFYSARASVQLAVGQAYFGSLIDLNADSATINNSGDLTGGINATIAANDLSFRNSGTIEGVLNGYIVPATIRQVGHQTNDPSQGYLGQIDQASATFFNSGTISGGASFITAANTVTASNTGSITSVSAGGYDPYAGYGAALSVVNSTQNNQTVTVTNSGTLTSSRPAGSALSVATSAGYQLGVVGAVAPAASKSDISVGNSGVLRSDGGAYFQAAVPPYFAGGVETPGYLTVSTGLSVTAFDTGSSSVTITNGVNGLITANGPTQPAPQSTVGIVPPEVANVGPIALLASASNVTIVNSGQITGGAGGDVRVTTYAGGLTGLDGTFVAGAIQTVNSKDLVTNTKTGVITGSIDLGSGDDTLKNYGAIIGNIYLRGGNDSLVHGLGATFNGIADGGAGTNTLIIDITGGGTLSQSLLDKFINFDSPVIIGSGPVSFGGPLALPSLVLSGADLTVAVGQTLKTAGPVAITASGGSTVTNLGAISGDVLFTTGDNDFANAGAVFGAVTFGAGNDRLTLMHGGSISGLVDGGGGANQLVLALSGTDVAPEEVDLSTVTRFGATRQNSGVVAISGVFATGTLDVVGGRLIGRTGSMITASTVTIAPGATFGSAGTVIGNVVVAGTVSPGSSPGTMTVVGNVSLATGSNSYFELTPTVTDKLLISGGLAIASGSTLTLVGSRPQSPGSTVDLIVATGGITGAYSTVVKPSAIFGYIKQSRTTLSLVGQYFLDPASAPQVAAGVTYVNGLLTSGSANPALITALRTLTTSTGATNAAAFAALSPEPYASVAQIGVENGLTIAESLRVASVTTNSEPGWFTFGQGFGDRRSLQGDAAVGTARGDISSEGTLGGIGFGANKTAISAFVGYLYSRQDISALGDRNQADGIVAGVNAHVEAGAAVVGVTLAYDGAGATTRRAPPGGAGASAHYNLHSFIADMSFGYVLPVTSAVTMMPRLGFTHVATSRGSGAEAGTGPFTLAVIGQRYNADFVDVALLFSDHGGSRTKLSPWLSLGVRYQLDGARPLATASFADQIQSFTVAGVSRGSTVATLDAGLDYRATNTVSLFGAYSGQFGQRGSDSSLNAGLRISF